MIGAGNDKQVRFIILLLSIISITVFVQFRILTEEILERPSLSSDKRFLTNSLRVANRTVLVDIISKALREHPREYWISRFTGKGLVKLKLFSYSQLKRSSVPFGPINNIAQTFAHPQAVARGSTVEVQVSFRKLGSFS